MCLIIRICICFPGVRCLKGRQGTKTYQPVVLKFKFDSSYNCSNKYCCKLSPGRCNRLFDSAGFTSSSLEERLLITTGDGWIEFKITNVQDQDAGYYRCLVTDVQHQLYQDYHVTLSGKWNRSWTVLFPVTWTDSSPSSTEVSDGHVGRQPSVTPTVKTSSVTLPQSTGGVPGEDFTDDRRYSLSRHNGLFPHLNPSFPEPPGIWACCSPSLPPSQRRF